MQIFYNEQEHPVPIDTDAELEVETIHEAVWKSYFPGQIVLLVMGINAAAGAAARRYSGRKG